MLQILLQQAALYSFGLMQLILASGLWIQP